MGKLIGNQTTHKFLVDIQFVDEPCTLCTSERTSITVLLTAEIIACN